MSEIVSDLVVQAHAAAAEAIAWHYRSLRSSAAPDASVEAIAHALDYGYDADLDERTSPAQPVGFNHQDVSLIFRRRLRPILQSRVSHHIWEADEDQGLFSLFGRTPSKEAWSRTPRRTRASALVQHHVRNCRNFRQAEKASRTLELSRMVTIPSPLLIANQLLGDPKSEGSQAYAAAALQEWVREQIELEDGQAIDLSFAAISEALTLINNRWKTSKPIVADLQQNGSTVIFLCNVLAIQGIAAMRVDLAELAEAARAVTLDADDDHSFSVSRDVQDMDRCLRALWLGERGASSEFLINPQYVELPSPGAILNLINSLPVPFEGGNTIFQGGIRLSADGSLVATISGDFGTGKTLFGLSLAAALAPLGCRTLFLSCEESAKDIQSRLMEAAPRALFRMLPLFKALDEDDFKLRRFERQMTSDDGADGVAWFSARQLQVQQSLVQNPGVDPASGLAALLSEAIRDAEIFKPWRPDSKVKLPHFARPVVIVDGLHQLFDFPETYDVWDSSLRSLIETCRNLGAIFLFSFSSDADELKRLEYLCDLIIEVERGGYDSPSEKPNRVFQLLKARRQPARTGAHVFHLRGDAGFRLKPSVDARVQELKSQLWWTPTERAEIFLTDDAPPGFRSSGERSARANNLSISNHGQVLVIGEGSTGKAGFGLYLLHRRWFDMAMIRDDRQLKLPIENQGRRNEVFPAWKQAALHAGLPVSNDASYLETRVLVISFLYQRSYYDDLTSRLAGRRKGKAEREQSRYRQFDDLDVFEYAPLPDRPRTDTIELYPGMLSVEDFLAKVEKRLSAAEKSGLPYTGVLVDGLHNVFVQFPALEQESSFWGMFYNILRRRRVTVVTTHTEFDIKSHADDAESQARNNQFMAYDFQQAQRKIAPLLSALVSGADYLFDLSPGLEAKSQVYRLTPRAMLGAAVSGQSFAWDKRQLRLDSLSSFRSEKKERQSTDRAETARQLGERLIALLGPTLS